MRKLILYIAASLDGFIAKSDGNIDWLHDESLSIEGEDFGYTAFLNTIDTTLMGNKTYEMICSFDMPFPYIDQTNFVFSRSIQKEKHDSVQFIREDMIQFTHQLKNNAGKNIWLIGGGIINTQLLNAGLIDEIILTLIPVTLGNGIKIFEDNLKMNNFTLQESKTFNNGMVQLTLHPT